MKYQAVTLLNYRQHPLMATLPKSLLDEIQVVGTVLPFRTNNFVLSQVDWTNPLQDPLFRLTIPTRKMLLPRHYEQVEKLLSIPGVNGALTQAVLQIRRELNPNPAGQLTHNVPSLKGVSLSGVQHKYRETVLLFPAQGQSCHAYCTYCFRWPQFVGVKNQKFATKQAEELAHYLLEHPEVTDVLITGGDPMVMNASLLRTFIAPLLVVDSLRTIRLGSKSLTYWPYRFTSDADSSEVLRLFEEVVSAGKHLAFMAHMSHVRQLENAVVEEAIALIRQTGAVIRSQSPLMRTINDDSLVWVQMWQRQVSMGIVPYYMFVARDTGAQHHFAVPLANAYQIYTEAYSQVSGLCRTVRGPSMSTMYGKILVEGVTEILGERVFVLKMVQARNSTFVGSLFFAKFDPGATWLSDLKPAFGEAAFLPLQPTSMVSLS